MPTASADGSAVSSTTNALIQIETDGPVNVGEISASLEPANLTVVNMIGRESVGGAVFKASRIRNLEAINVNVPLSARLRAFYSIISGQLLGLGDSPLADVKDQTINAASNIGLLSALILTVSVPFFLDCAYGVETNAYGITNPGWVGPVFFTLAVASSWAFGLSAALAVLTILVLNECTQAESRYLSSLASSELNSPLKVFMLGWTLVVIMLAFWLAIVTLGLSSAEICEDDPMQCKNTPITFIACLVAVNILSTYAVNDACKLVAKLYQTRGKLAADVFRDDKQNPCYLDVNASKVWQSLEAYFKIDRASARPISFKEHLLKEAKGPRALSYVTEQRVDTLFAEKVKQLLNEEHKAIVAKLEMKSDTGLSTYPKTLEHV